jgi:hypothetical protein
MRPTDWSGLSFTGALILAEFCSVCQKYVSVCKILIAIPVNTINRILMRLNFSSESSGRPKLPTNTSVLSFTVAVVFAEMRWCVCMYACVYVKFNYYTGRTAESKFDFFVRRSFFFTKYLYKCRYVLYKIFIVYVKFNVVTNLFNEI